MDCCPKCGAAAEPGPTWVPTYACGSNEEPFEDIGFRQTDRCRIAELNREIAELRLANAAWRSDHYIWIGDNCDAIDAIEQPRVSIATDVLRQLLAERDEAMAKLNEIKQAWGTK